MVARKDWLWFKKTNATICHTPMEKQALTLNRGKTVVTYKTLNFREISRNVEMWKCGNVEIDF